MVIYLVDGKTGRYFQGPDGWTAQREKATAFDFGSHAIEVAFQRRLNHVELLLGFEVPWYEEIRIPFETTPGLTLTVTARMTVLDRWEPEKE